MQRKIWVSVVIMILIVSFVPIIIEIAQTRASTIIEVDDDGGKDYKTIQEAVDAAQPGDIVFVYNGTYNENIFIDKTINLTGISRDNTTINGTDIVISVDGADYINITGFTIKTGGTAGIRFNYSNNSLIMNNRVEENDYGIQILRSNDTIIKNNIVSNNSLYDGIYVSESRNTTIENNDCINNNGRGIYLRRESSNTKIIGNNVSENRHGIYISDLSNNNTIINNIILSNTGTVAWAAGLSIYASFGNLIVNNSILNNKNGLNWNDEAPSTNPNIIINCTIRNSSVNDLRIKNTYGTILNTTFNKTNTTYLDTTSILNVKWFLHVNVTDFKDNPIVNANVIIEDNINGSFNQTYITGSDGFIRWIPITEYIERDSDGDTIGEKTFYSPHKIVAWNDTLVGYAYPNPFIDESKIVTIVLYNGTLLGMEPGWNLLSLPRIQSDTNLQTVLQSIEGLYDAVQWYNITDNNDHWKHYHISKPSYMNDLDNLNHTLGFWLHITDSEKTTLVVLGDELSSDQNISLYPGWNLVGYPSKLNKTRDIALDNLFYGTDIDSIWTYNAITQNWMELDEATDFFEIGQGYWIHSKVTEVWNVPL
jgi:parallel beta-helix repeat protein